VDSTKRAPNSILGARSRDTTPARRGRAVIKFEVATYSISAYAGQDKPVHVYMNDDTGRYRGYIAFHEGTISADGFVVHGNGIINAFMPMSKLPTMLDVLRNEKPVYFNVNEQYKWASLSTGAEPTGEEEGPAG
jgi:hypothetical protein